MNNIDRALEFSYSKGFKNIAEAIGEMGLIEFRKQSKVFIPKPKVKEVKPNVKFSPRPKEMIPEIIRNNKPFYLNNNYLIFNDGRVYSKLNNKFLKPRYSDGHVYYELGKDNKYTGARLVFFHFCKHDKKKIEQLDQISTKDKNPKNLWWENLEELSKKQVMKKHGINSVGKGGGAKPKIKEMERELLTMLLKGGFSQEKIGELYGTSAMSVNRFIKRHQISI